MNKILERVGRGIKVLDEKDPDWWKEGRIDLRKLDLRSRCDCVLGQRHKDFLNGLAFLVPMLSAKTDDLEERLWAGRHGFCHPARWIYLAQPTGGKRRGALSLYSASAFYYRALTACWREEIMRRRAQAPPVILAEFQAVSV